MSIAIILTLFVFGTAIGSFLNVVTMRYELLGRILFTRTIGGRSHCPRCMTTLRWYELLPIISFLLQRGTCRHCAYRLSWQYPLVEIITGLLTAATGWAVYLRFAPQLLATSMAGDFWLWVLIGFWLLVGYALIVLSIIDLKHGIIPDAINAFLFVMGLMMLAIRVYLGDSLAAGGSFLGGYAGFMPWRELSLVTQGLISAAVGGMLFGGIILFTRGKGMGLGDLKLVIPMGFLLGWPDIVLALAASFVIGAVVSILLMMLRLKSFKDGVPFGPFLAASIFVVLYFGEAIMNVYFIIPQL